MEARIIEIFSSIQGEGPWVGVRQIFIRFAGCNLHCRYCDTPHQADASGRLEIYPGAGRFDQFANPVSPAQVVEMVNRLNPQKKVHSISLTGGEPLLHAGFLSVLISELKKEGVRIYLETNGSLPEALKDVLEGLDFISMDIKLPSSTGSSPLWEIHRSFLRTAAPKPVFVKTVVNARTTADEMGEACRIIAAVNPRIPLVIQPVTDKKGSLMPISVQSLLKLQDIALGLLDDVRVIPQVHTYLGLL